ncbi:ATP-binding protein [Streptomyces qinzhouensis]|uniref:ATP-binding protein n=1 Tax=Streptomyces qinzhouensis TaxID=2599401 RepID=A0A5B8J976_9ACTN|nr:ATP-binding protein [Streptomyces qinzhouensis]QDY78375.1 ATP-binding protein [Streptomyces qinzhouensis]
MNVLSPPPSFPVLRERFYPRARQTVPAAREFVRGIVREWVPAARLDDVLVCVSELTTNAVLHGVPPGRGYRVRVCRFPDGLLRVEVHDSGDGFTLPPVPGPAAEPEGESGRGLLIVDALADKWGVGDRLPGKVVWCEFGVSGAG